MKKKQNKVSVISPKVALTKIQDLVGVVKSMYLNDRMMDRDDNIVPILDEIFDICFEVRSRWKS